MSGDGAARARIEDIRRTLTTTTEAGARSRLRVRLADVLSALGDVELALGELRQAAAEAPPSGGLMFAVRALAPRLSPEQAASLRAAARAGRPGLPAAPPPTRSRPRRSAVGEVPLLPTVTALQAAPAPAPLPVIARDAGDRIPAGSAATEPLEAALAALKEGKPVRARRLAEEASRTPAAGGDRKGRARELAALVEALERAGARRQSLLLARTLAERATPDPAATGAGPSPSDAAALATLVTRATDSGERNLAMRWRADIPATLRPLELAMPRSRDDADGNALMRFRAAQRAVLAASSGGSVEAAITRLFPLLDGHPGRAAALALGERLLAGAGERAPETRAELLRLAFQGERAPRRRQMLAQRWVETLKRAGDTAAAIAALE